MCIFHMLDLPEITEDQILATMRMYDYDREQAKWLLQHRERPQRVNALLLLEQLRKNEPTYEEILKALPKRFNTKS